MTKKDFPVDVKESAHKVWLAGLGALAVAEEEGSKFFKNLVKRGEKLEAKRKKHVEKAVDRVKEGVDDVREEVESRWQAFGDSFDRKIGEVVERLGVPNREEIHKLTRRVADLTAKLEKLQQQGKGAPAASKPAARKPAARKTASRAAAKPAAKSPKNPTA
ncbi:MAG: phasin family protein [Acidobacteriota bacterium]|nr:phasin family protein [Acidobacteriota bacterium]MDH3524530.1 phasin family protein [Acidobacteriota bacterium]